MARDLQGVLDPQELSIRKRVTRVTNFNLRTRRSQALGFGGPSATARKGWSHVEDLLCLVDLGVEDR